MRTLVIYPLALLAVWTLAVAQPLGDTLVIGHTWLESQHRGAPAPTAAMDLADYKYFFWAEGEYLWFIYYNIVTPQGHPIFLNGAAAFQNEPSGSPVVDLYHDQWPAIACNSTINQFMGSAIFFNPTGIMYLGTALPWYQGQATHYPRFRLDRQDRFHFLTRLLPVEPGDAVNLLYISAIYDSIDQQMDFAPAWTFVDSIISPTYELAASPVSDRVAIAWTTPHDDHWGYQPGYIDNDLMLLIDDDGQDLHFEDAINLTNFIDPDPSWLPDTTTANMDTFRVHDFSVMFDDSNDCHVVFTTRAYFEIQGVTYWHASIIWHWAEQYPNEFNVVHNAFDDWWWNFTNCGDGNVKAQRPSLAQDPETGYILCVYQVYDCDTTHISLGGYPSGEIYVSASADGGLSWSVGTNITQTITPQNAPIGDCWSEVGPFLAGISGGNLHIQYVLDKDAGDGWLGEGAMTLNPVIYHQGPVERIPITPLVPQDIFLHVNTIGVEPSPSSHIPSSFVLYPPHPNPFNPATVLTFDLPAAGLVKLEVFDINGRSVGAQHAAPLRSGSEATPTMYPAGTHQIPFDGSGLPSGIYLARLTAGDWSAVQKLVLMK